MTIYCDHNATTPLRPEVLDAMLPFLRGEMGNPSSVHRLGSAARCAVEEARADVASLIGADPSEVVFTSGGTESNNLAIEGAARVLDRCGSTTIVTIAIEHSSVRAPIAALAGRGWTSVEWPLADDGRVLLDRIADSSVAPGLVSIAWANNELGTVQPIPPLAKSCRERGALFHADAVQAAGKIPVSCEHVDLLSLSAHKLGGPKGVGALFVRRGVEIEPLFRGGGQERDRRPGTENVAGIVGFGVACRLAAAELESYASRCSQWRDRLWSEIARRIPACRRNSPANAGCLPNTLHVSFEEVRGEALVAALDLEGFAVSSGSACAAGAGEPSHVLLALGRSADEARNGVRFSCGRDSELTEIEAIVACTERAVERIRRASP